MQALYLNCPELNDLNLNSCKNLHPGMHLEAYSLIMISVDVAIFKSFSELVNNIQLIIVVHMPREIVTSVP